MNFSTGEWIAIISIVVALIIGLVQRVTFQRKIISYQDAIVSYH